MAELDGVAHSLFLVCAEALKIILSRTSPYLHAGMAFGLSDPGHLSFSWRTNSIHRLTVSSNWW